MEIHDDGKPAAALPPRTDALDYYARGLPGKWQTMADGRGELMTGGAPHLADDGLELVFWRRRPEERGGTDLYLARRTAVTEPFGEAVYQEAASTPATERIPAFARGGLVLYFLHCPTPVAQQTYDTPRTVWWASRANRQANFGTSRPLADFPTITGSGTHFSPDERITFVQGLDRTTQRAVRRGDGTSFDLEATNLPRQEGVQSEVWPVAVSNRGALVFTHLAEGKPWLCVAQTAGGPQAYTVERLWDLNFEGHGQAYSVTLSRDARLLIGWLDHELIATRVPEEHRQKILRTLGN